MPTAMRNDVGSVEVEVVDQFSVLGRFDLRTYRTPATRSLFKGLHHSSALKRAAFNLAVSPGGKRFIRRELTSDVLISHASLATSLGLIGSATTAIHHANQWSQPARSYLVRLDSALVPVDYTKLSTAPEDGDRFDTEAKSLQTWADGGWPGLKVPSLVGLDCSTNHRTMTTEALPLGLMNLKLEEALLLWSTACTALPVRSMPVAELSEDLLNRSHYPALSERLAGCLGEGGTTARTMLSHGDFTLANIAKNRSQYFGFDFEFSSATAPYLTDPIQLLASGRRAQIQRVVERINATDQAPERNDWLLALMFLLCRKNQNIAKRADEMVGHL